MAKRIFDTVIFDLGGVLIDWNPRYLYRKIFSNESEMEYFLSEICSPYWNELQDGGRTIQEATNSLISQFPDHSEHIRAFYGRWEEMLGGVFEETIDILDFIHQEGSHRLLALTNWSAETFPVARKRYEFLNRFEGILVSGKENMKKPDPEIYKLIMDRYNLDGAKSLFIDDSERNVLAARDSGLEAIRFTSAWQLKLDLQDLGILK